MASSARDWNVDAALARVGELLVAGHAHPDPHRRDDAEGRIKGGHRHVETDLVVALARAAVRDRPGAALMRRLDQQPRDQRAGERGRERVLPLVERAGLQCGPDVVGHERRSRVDDDRAPRATGQGALVARRRHRRHRRRRR